MTMTRFLKPAALLCVTAFLAGPAMAQSFKSQGGTPITCNPSTNLKPWTCTCKTDDECDTLAAKCEHVDGKYYQCDDDQSTGKSATMRPMLKLKRN